MSDMLDLILTTAADPAEHPHLREEIAAHLAAVRASAGGGKPDLVAQAEETVRGKPGAAFSFDSAGCATLTSAGYSWSAGRFETISIGELRERARRQQSRSMTPRARLWVFVGASPLTDIGNLQAANSDNTLFQAASQFNCLESPGPYVTSVANYFHDQTQGPRASISAFPATLLRHYRAPGPGGELFVQTTDTRQIDLLADSCGPGASQNGYFTGEGVADPQSLVTALETRFEAIRVGVHDHVQVVLGYDWSGAVEDSEHRRIAQVFTSTVAGGGYGGQRNFRGELFKAACRLLLRAAYLGTLLAAAHLGRTRVVLTLIGGGVFGNPITLIWDAILWAFEEVKPFLSHELDVIVNGYNLGTQIDLDTVILPAVQVRGGTILAFDRTGLVAIHPGQV
jgi:hypothetical protein